MVTETWLLSRDLLLLQIKNKINLNFLEGTSIVKKETKSTCKVMIMLLMFKRLKSSTSIILMFSQLLNSTSKEITNMTNKSSKQVLENHPTFFLTKSCSSIKINIKRTMGGCKQDLARTTTVAQMVVKLMLKCKMNSLLKYLPQWEIHSIPIDHLIVTKGCTQEITVVTTTVLVGLR